MPKSKKIIIAGLSASAVLLALIFGLLGLSWWWPLVTLLILASGVAISSKRSPRGVATSPQAPQASKAQQGPKVPTLSTPEEAQQLVERYTKHPARQRDRQVKRKEPDYTPARALVIEHIVSLVLQPLMGKNQHLEQCFKALSAEILRHSMLEADAAQRQFYQRRAAERAPVQGNTLPAVSAHELTPSSELEAEVKQHLISTGVHPLLITAAMAYAHRRLHQGQVKPWEELKWFELRPQAIGAVVSYLNTMVTHSDQYDLSPELCAQYRKLITKLEALRS